MAFVGLAPDAARAQTNPFKAADDVVTWFVSLNTKFDGIVILEERRQFLRRLNRLSKSLFELEADSVQLRDQLPTAPPTQERTEYIREQISAIRESLASTMAQARELGHQIRVQGGQTSIDAVRQFGATRGQVLDFLENTLLYMRLQGWDRAAVVAQLDRGIASVRNAQDEVNRFAARVAAMK
jgi:hypothetical protein